MKTIARRPESLRDVKTHFCPGCTHGIVHRLVAECIDEMEMRERTVGICPVGCAVLSYDYFNFDMMEAAHGRAPAMATAIKRLSPDTNVFTYQGDGDLASIGMAEVVHAAIRGESITVIFINNAIYGMTGGQMAPTTILGQKTSTSPYGRSREREGYPAKIAELLAPNEGSAYVARVSVHDPANVVKAKKAIKKAFETQQAHRGFSLVEVLSTCPTNWGMNPLEALEWVEKEMIAVYPLGEFANKEA